jgi:hypothetical protein
MLLTSTNLWLVLVSGQPRYSGVQKVFDHPYLGPRRLGTTVSTVLAGDQ